MSILKCDNQDDPLWLIYKHFRELQCLCFQNGDLSWLMCKFCVWKWVLEQSGFDQMVGSSFKMFVFGRLNSWEAQVHLLVCYSIRYPPWLKSTQTCCLLSLQGCQIDLVILKRWRAKRLFNRFPFQKFSNSVTPQWPFNSLVFQRL